MSAYRRAPCTFTLWHLIVRNLIRYQRPNDLKRAETETYVARNMAAGLVMTSAASPFSCSSVNNKEIPLQIVCFSVRQGVAAQ